MAAAQAATRLQQQQTSQEFEALRRARKRIIDDIDKLGRENGLSTNTPKRSRARASSPSTPVRPIERANIAACARFAGATGGNSRQAAAMQRDQLLRNRTHRSAVVYNIGTIVVHRAPPQHPQPQQPPHRPAASAVQQPVLNDPVETFDGSGDEIEDAIMELSPRSLFLPNAIEVLPRWLAPSSTRPILRAASADAPELARFVDRSRSDHDVEI